MYKTMCRSCLSKLMDRYTPIEVEGTETIGQCEWCQYLSPGDKPLMQYELTPRYRKRRAVQAEAAPKKDTRARYKEPFRVDF